MFSRDLQNRVASSLQRANVRINGARPWDIVVHDPRFYSALVSRASLGLGESYMDHWWDCADLSEFFCHLLHAHLDRRLSLNWTAGLAFLRARIANRQAKSQATENVHQHYDKGNALYQNMLGRWMLYSSANWEHASNLDQAGEAKLEFVCKKLHLRSGQRVLDIGCGWGGFAKYAAQRYGVHVVGITLSTEQVYLAREWCADLPVEIRLQDYRELHEKFDHIVSLGMFEHVGHKNYRQYMHIVHRCLNPDGLFLLNTIGANRTSYSLNPWTDKYIFPGAMLPSVAQIGAAVDGVFVMEELQNWPGFYDRTLMAWYQKFQSNWNKLREAYSDRFRRMWEYYLLSSAGAFRSKAIQDWHILLSCS
ncbi:MAG TPA: cyclopropane fatty acyl phospholipid synthase [Candidatus Sulfotelmatobacter sp.]|nr:cyclopropane fatty acyl phospholipid synthase [Candidatus Sulfotelmatobacter sp.]